MPGNEDLARARAALRELFRKYFDSKVPQTRTALAARLIAMAKKDPDKPAEQYAMLDEARNLATKQG